MQVRVSPAEVVNAFLTAFYSADFETAQSLVAEDSAFLGLLQNKILTDRYTSGLLGEMARLREFSIDRATEQAMELFWSRGYNGTSTRDLEGALGIGAGSLYAAFGSKDALFVAALERYIEHWKPLAHAAREAVAAGTPVKQAIRDLFRTVRQQISAENHHGCLMVKAAMERAGEDSAVGELVHRLMLGLESVLIEIIARGQERGEITSKRSPQDLARFLVMTLNGLRVMRLVHPDGSAVNTAFEVALSCLD